MPGADSFFWVPARAVLGDRLALLIVLAGALLLLGAAMAVFSARFGEHALAASNVAAGSARRPAARGFRMGSPAAVLRRKEWMLLRRDPWLASQTLTQLLYLLPPALLLSRNFGDVTGSLTVIVLVLVTVGGQLAGGLGWLAVSGEDAPDLIASAPVPAGAVLRAKIEAVLGAIAVVFAPLVAILALASPHHAAVAAVGVAVSAASCVQIQIWFRAQAKRSHFRRRQISSRLATFAEAFSSFSWAGTAGLVASGAYGYAAGSAVFALLILFGARTVAPRQAA
jgi:ABC-2 type transport system permease protein